MEGALREVLAPLFDRRAEEIAPEHN